MNVVVVKQPVESVVVVRPIKPIIQVTATRGPSGFPGPQGEPGTPSAGAFYSHDQAEPSSEWIIVHNFGFRPGGILVFDSAGTEVEGEITDVDSTTLTISFLSPFGGRADIS